MTITLISLRIFTRISDSVDDVVDKTAALKLSDTAAGKTGSEKTPPVIKRNISGYKLER